MQRLIPGLSYGVAALAIAAGFAASHSSSASESTNRTRSTCREMDCFW